MEALTKKQQAILDYMKGHVAQHSYWPSIRDIQAKFRFASTNAVFGHLQALERKGVIQRIPGAARAYKIAQEVEPDLSETVIRYEGPDEEAIDLQSLPIPRLDARTPPSAAGLRRRPSEGSSRERRQRAAGGGRRGHAG